MPRQIHPHKRGVVAINDGQLFPFKIDDVNWLQLVGGVFDPQLIALAHENEMLGGRSGALE
jgi:hypothetical protein